MFWPDVGDTTATKPAEDAAAAAAEEDAVGDPDGKQHRSTTNSEL